MSKEHEHNYMAEKYQVQELSQNYIDNSSYKRAILIKERIMLFCTTCGNKIEATEEGSDNDK